MSWLKDLRGAFQGLAKLAEKRTLENPETPISSVEAIQHFGGVPTSTGVQVNEQTAMSVASILAGVQVLTRAVASLSLETYRRQENGGRSRATDHPVYRMLKYRPNPFMTGANYRELMLSQLIFRGNHYAEIEFDRDGYPVALWPMDPRATDVVYTERKSLVYVTTIENKRVGIPSWRVLHVSTLGNGIKGAGLLDYARETIGVASALDQYQGKFFANGAHTSGFLKHPGKLTDDAKKRLKKAWTMAYGGLSNAHRTAVLEEGIEWVKTSVSPEEAQAIESRKFTRSEIAGILQVPPHKIGDLERATFTNIEHQNISFIVDSLRYWLVGIEQELNWKFFIGEPDVFAEFNVDSLLRGDKKARAEALEIERRNGVLTSNEWRQLENRNPIESDYGDSYLIQMNNALIGRDGAITPLTTPSTSARKEGSSALGRSIALQFLETQVRRISRREVRSFEEFMKSSDAQTMEREEAVRAFYADQSWIAEVLEPAARACARVGIEVDMNGYLARSMALISEGDTDDWEDRRVEAELYAAGGENAK